MGWDMGILGKRASQARASSQFAVLFGRRLEQVEKIRVGLGKGIQLSSFLPGCHAFTCSVYSLRDSPYSLASVQLHMCVQVLFLAPTLTPTLPRLALWTPCWTTRSCSHGDCATWASP